MYFYYDFISIFFTRTLYMIHDREKNMDWKELQQKNKQTWITMEFWMTKFGPYFQKSLSWSFFVGLIFFSPLTSMLNNCLDGQPFLWILLID